MQRVRAANRGEEHETLLGTPLVPVPPEARRVELSNLRVSHRVRVGWLASGTVAIRNSGTQSLPALAVNKPQLVMLATRWRARDGGLVEGQPLNSRLPSDLLPGATEMAEFNLFVPAVPGVYRLEVGLVQDGKWFSEADGSIASAEIEVIS
jgi:hypothetical protein